MDLSTLDHLAVIGAGFGAGVVAASVGVASLVSFPVLLALGLPPVTANASNTVGLVPGGLSGSFGYRRELRMHPRVTAAVVLTSAVGAVAGAVLLLALSPDVFESLVPWLILFACLLVGFQPLVARRLRERRTGPQEDRLLPSTPTTVALGAAGVYGGYFGAGQGVMVVAVLGLGLDIDLKVVNGLKTVACLAANVVATVIFVVAADLDWAVIGLLGIGSVVGGYVGSRIGRLLPDALFRGLVVVGGSAAAIALMLT
ncbi:sulfite exporter TauE/SafE family protein [Aeromicrobium sp. CFBP 8757]|uniref:sulfite exporter TauE/SafE family protein n=1 Tax=Aeromicrobium sp. CFBP 8757 TaxID=2775288 RepID=UPI00178391EB|nr:sulfite exporter TauE/SafE family protein [Aeromicrobium sp. CFBP 8757]